MSRATGKDHARINLDIWGDDDWLDLTPPAQHLYFVLWTSPQLSYCGTGDWDPAKIAAKANGWTAAAVEQAAAELARELFLLIDTDTNEFILRSWMKHDGLWRTPNMAVSMANARADLASRTLRGVVVFEVLKLRKHNPDSSAWERKAVVDMLSQKAIDPASLAPFTPTLTLPLTVAPNVSVTPRPTVPVTLNGGVGVNPTANGAHNPGPTPAPSPATTTEGYVSRERHLPNTPDPNAPRPQERCPKHRNVEHPPACGGCADARRAAEDWDTTRAAQDRDRRRIARQVIDDCPVCDDNGFVLDDDDTTSRCPEHPTAAEILAATGPPVPATATTGNNTGDAR